MQKADTPQVKIVQSSQSGVVSGTTKTITLAQAQQMGYFGGAKFVPHITPGKQTIMLNKTTPPNRVKVVPQVIIFYLNFLLKIFSCLLFLRFYF